MAVPVYWWFVDSLLLIVIVLVALLVGLLVRRRLLARPGRDRKSTRLNSSHLDTSRMPSSA